MIYFKDKDKSFETSNMKTKRIIKKFFLYSIFLIRFFLNRSFFIRILFVKISRRDFYIISNMLRYLNFVYNVFTFF